MTERKRAEEHLAALEAFMASCAYEYYLEAQRTAIETLEKQLIACAPSSIENFCMHWSLRGELTAQEQMLQIFEDGRRTLKARINEIIECENETASERKI